MDNTYNLKNKKVLITGANGQIGQAITSALLTNGALVYITDVQTEIAPELLVRLKTNGLNNFEYHTLDVSDERSVSAAAVAINDVDVLINNAGIAVFTPFEQRTTQEIDQVLMVNVKGTILCSQIFSQPMVEKKHGKIINIGSIYGVVPADSKIYGNSGRNSSEIYGASKAAVIHLTKYLAAYLGQYNINVNAISPGGVFNNQQQNFVDNYTDKTPLGRMASTDDLAGIICFLASDDSKYITGQNITVDGGFTLNQ